MSLPHSIWTCYRALPENLEPESLGPNCLEPKRPEISEAALATWLTAAELVELAHWRHAARRRQWLHARRLAKQMIQHATAAASLLDVQVLSRDERGLGVEPRVTLLAGADQHTTTWRLSISHSPRGVLIGLAPAEEYCLGVDLVASGTIPASLQRAWFTKRELELLGSNPQVQATVVWAIKEAVYKAANRGRSWSPRDVEVLAIGPDHVDCTYRGQRLHDLRSEIQQVDGHVAASVCLPASGRQTSLNTTTTAVLCS